MLLSIDRRFIFIHVPRTAGSSITRALEVHALHVPRTPLRRLLSHLPVPEDPRKAYLRIHDTAAWLRLKLPREVFQGYHKFAVVRNPFDNALSHYLFLKGNPAQARHREVSRLTFAQYLEGKGRRNAMAQANWLTDRAGRLLVDEILRFESLDRDYAALARRLGIDPDLPHINASRPAALDGHFGPRETALVRDLFDRDFDLFGYSRDLPAPGQGS